MFIISFLISSYMLAVIIYVAMGWLIAFDIVNEENDAAVRLMTFLHKITDPVFTPIRKYVPPIAGMDFTPLIVIIGLQLIASIF